MTREDIYDHLAQVYLGKRNKAEEKKKKQFNAWLLINIVITMIIFASAFYGLTAFLAQRNGSPLESSIIFSLHNGPIRVDYDFSDPFPPTKVFSLAVPKMDATKYSKLEFTIRGKEEGTPGVVKILLKNKRNESAAYFVKGVGLEWQNVSIPLSEFDKITDWSTLDDISFVLEEWNVDKKKGIMLVDGLSFSNPTDVVKKKF